MSDRATRPWVPPLADLLRAAEITCTHVCATEGWCRVTRSPQCVLEPEPTDRPTNADKAT